MNFKIKLISVILFICLMPQWIPLYSQSSELSNGNRIRVSASEYFINPAVGSFEQISSDSLYFQMGNKVFGLPINQIQKLEKSEISKRNTKKGILIGAISGGLLTGAVFYGIEQNSEGWNKIGQPGFTGGFALGSLVGGGIGALIGSSTHTDSWYEILINEPE